MFKNNQIRKSDKKFIRLQKAQIRATFLDLKKQEELINNLYKKFEKQTGVGEVKKEIKEPKKVEIKKEQKIKAEKVVKKNK